MAAVSEQGVYAESRARDRRLAGFAHWEEIQVRLQHRWPPDRVISWHEQKYPGELCPAKTTLFRYVKSKPPGWFISRLVLAESGTQTVHRELVAERQAELIETMIMRLQAALKFEKEMNGILVPEVTRNFELLNRLLMDHFRVLQELGVEPRHGSIAPTGAPAAESGPVVAKLVERIVQLPTEQFLPLMHDMYRQQYEANKHKAPRSFPNVSDVQARRVEPANGEPAG